MSNIANRKNFTFIVPFYANPVPLFQQAYVPFEPDEVIIKTVMYQSYIDELGAEPTFVYTDIIQENNQPICFITGGDPAIVPCMYYNPQTHFTLKKPFNNTINFTFMTAEGVIQGVLTGRSGLFSIHCEFVQYK